MEKHLHTFNEFELRISFKHIGAAHSANGGFVTRRAQK